MEAQEKIDFYISKQTKYKDALIKLRTLLLSTELEETVKWKMPTYTINGKNVIGISAFKNHFGMWFFNGALLKDTHNVLKNAQEGKTQAMRQLRFETINDIDENLVLEYIKEAIENQKKGLVVKFDRKPKELILSDELNSSFANDAEFKKAFYSLTPGKQREYADYITEAKRLETKLKRIEKITPMILNGIGLNDKYKNC